MFPKSILLSTHRDLCDSCHPRDELAGSCYRLLRDQVPAAHLFSYGHVIRCITTKAQTCSRTSSTRPFLLSRTDTWKHSQVRSHCVVGMRCALLEAEMVICDRTRVGYRDQRGSCQRGSREACSGEGMAQCSVDRTRRCSSRMVNFSICQEGNYNERTNYSRANT